MKEFILLALLVICSLSGFAENDTSKVFVSKDDFLKGRTQLISRYYIKEKFWGGWSGFTYQAEGVIRFKSNDKKLQQFLPGSVFAFQTNELTYVYDEQTKKYLTLIYRNEDICLYIGEQEHVIYKGVTVDELIFYSKTPGQNLTLFTQANVEKDFRDSSKKDNILKFRSELFEKHLDQAIYRKQMVQIRAMAEKWLSN